MPRNDPALNNARQSHHRLSLMPEKDSRKTVATCNTDAGHWRIPIPVKSFIIILKSYGRSALRDSNPISSRHLWGW
ncbi:hypothetical protein OK016_18540 [Vibrio chagasii]|nr:hypothetical protein [Vibrio chagasii]